MSSLCEYRKALAPKKQRSNDHSDGSTRSIETLFVNCQEQKQGIKDCPHGNLKNRKSSSYNIVILSKNNLASFFSIAQFYFLCPG
jgi:hypothetical protein